MSPSFLFDFTFEKPNITLINNIPSNVSDTKPDLKILKNICPYRIPTLDEIVKDIKNASYNSDKHTLYDYNRYETKMIKKE